MTEIYPKWLEKEMLTGIRRFNIDAYLLALEGWRRGLTLSFYSHETDRTDLEIIGFDPIGKLFSLASEDKAHFFYRSRGDMVSNEAVDIGTDKERTKQYLEKAGVPVPEGFGFTSDDDAETVAETLFKKPGPFVLKPRFGSLGKGVATDIQSPEAFLDNLAYIKKTFDYTDFLVEQHIDGEEMRVYVVGDEAIAATKRIPANVTGDGRTSIEQLINDKNELRKENPHTATRLITIDERLKDYLSRQNFDLHDIIDAEQTVYLKGESNMSSGGDSVDVTDDISPEVQRVAVEAVKAIPGLLHAGVDMIVDKDQAVVIEVNSTAGTALHTFPIHGTHRNIAEKIIDYYFPETKDVERSSRLYFDYKGILNQLRSNSIQALTVTDAPEGDIYAKRYVISGKVQGVGYRVWAERAAIREGLHGYARNLKNGDVVVVVGGSDKNRVEKFKDLCFEGPRRARVSAIKDYVWEKRIRIGFEIKRR
ncbi:acylphosphatase [Salinicoccus roseus]|uniref:acylphosphatase n=1 Tax=Salinicoccus roseus TaxID=45670 RepID=UPI003524C093